jgi:hypothetical protein
VAVADPKWNPPAPETTAAARESIPGGGVMPLAAYTISTVNTPPIIRPTIRRE